MSWTQAESIEVIKKTDTKLLMVWRNICYGCGGEYDTVGDNSGRVVRHSDIVAELVTRPHLPGKKESKVLRKLMSVNKMTAEQVRAIPKFRTLLSEAQDRRG